MLYFIINLAIGVILVSLGYILSIREVYSEYKSRKGIFYFLIFFGVLTICLFISGKLDERSKDDTHKQERIIDSLQIDSQSTLIVEANSEIVSLNTNVLETNSKIDLLSNELIPFVKLAKKRFPDLGQDEALRELASSIKNDLSIIKDNVSKITPQLDGTIWSNIFDSTRNTYVNEFSFESSLQNNMSDIQISVLFDNIIDSVKNNTSCHARFGEDAPIQLEIENNGRGFKLSKKFLGSTCRIRVFVYSSTKLEIIDFKHN